MWSQRLLENNPDAQRLCLVECSPNYSCPRVQGVCYPAQREQTRATALTRLSFGGPLVCELCELSTHVAFWNSTVESICQLTVIFENSSHHVKCWQAHAKFLC